MSSYEKTIKYYRRKRWYEIIETATDSLFWLTLGLLLITSQSMYSWLALALIAVQLVSAIRKKT